MDINLTDQQAAGLAKIKDWYERPGPPSPFRLFGYAGTGKTTIARMVADAIEIPASGVVYGAFTGKAASVLRSKGATLASTIHRAIYKPTTSAEAREALRLAKIELAGYSTLQASLPTGRTDVETQEMRQRMVRAEGWASVLEFAGALDETRERVEELKAEAARIRFEWNPDSEWADADLIILDEVSMVSTSLAADVEAYGVPVLVLGDPAQLPPVQGGGHYINAEPDHLLTDVQRQALESPVLELATRIRQSTSGSLGLTPDDYRAVSLVEAMEHDQVLVWSNAKRWSVLSAIRARLGHPAGVPVTGDRVMCLANNSDLAVFNGQQFEVIESTPNAGGYALTVHDLDQGVVRSLNVLREGFEGRDMESLAQRSGAGRKGGRALATFSQAITVHKAQGSEWDSVYVVDETAAMISMTAKSEGRRAAETQGRRWLYTAVTRAAKEITVARVKSR